MLKSKFLIGASVAALSVPFAVSAQEFTYGAGLEVGEVSLSGRGPTETYEYQALYINGRVTYDINDQFYVGGELGFGTSIDGSAVDGIRRASLVGGYDVGPVDVFASVGFGQFDVDFSSGLLTPATYEGTTYALGVDYAYSDNAKIRVELVRDEFKSDGGIKENADNTALRIGAAFEF